MTDLTRILPSHSGAFLFALVFAEQAGVPVPAAPWLLAAGALSAAGELNPVLTIVLTALACVIADTGWFYAGRLGGQRVLRLFCWLSLSPGACVGRSKGVFNRHGLHGLIAAKFLPGLGAVMPPLAGALGVGTTRFLLFDGLGSLIYASFYVVTGFLFHNQLQQVMASLNRLGLSVFLLVLALISIYVGFRYFRRRKAALRRVNDEATRRISAPVNGAAILDQEGLTIGQGTSAKRFEDPSHNLANRHIIPLVAPPARNNLMSYEINH